MDIQASQRQQEKREAAQALLTDFNGAYADITTGWAALPDTAARVTAIRRMLVILAKAVRFLLKRELGL